MKKFICLIVLSVLFRVGHAQISGVKTIPGDYPSIRSAITALNTSGVGSGGVTFNVAAGYAETFNSLTAGLITATGTASNPIIFQKSGSGSNPIITAATPGVGTTDYVICLAGSDYVTFDGINIVENPLNTTATQMMERGFALLKNSGTDGCQYVTIKNCTIR
ncbi:MAG: hypothetical protein Q8867_09590, partial [Bacteroidota bacterium]|nr:hypothetical protein [Bacteroidota bacterium]